MESSHHRAGRHDAVLGVGFVVAAACLFAVNGTVSKLVLQSGLSSMRLVEIRSAGAAAVLCLAALARDRGGLRLRRRDLGFVALYGVVGVGMVQWLYFVAIARIPVSVALLVEFTAPALVALWVRFVRRQPVRGRLWPALLLVLTGLALVAQVWAGLTLDAVGLAAAAVDAAVLAGYYLLGERGLDDREPVPLAALGFAAAAAFWLVLLPPWSFPYPALAVPVAVSWVSVPAGLLVVWVVVLGSVVPFVLVLLGLRRIGATRAGLLGTLEPVLAGVVAWLVLGERLGSVQVAGAAVVLAGIVLAETARTPSAPGEPGVQPQPLRLSVPGARVDVTAPAAGRCPASGGTTGMSTRTEPWLQGNPSWVDLSSPDPVASQAFYRALFGWEVMDSGPEMGNYGMCMLGGRPAAGIGPQMGPAEGPPAWLTYLAVDDVESIAAAITANGGTVVAPPMAVGDAGRMAVAQDPTGAYFGVWQPGQTIGFEVFNETGAVVWNEQLSRDTGRARDFYAAVFGHTFTPIEGAEYWTIHVPGREDSVAGLGALDASVPAEVPPHWMTYFMVDDVDGSARKAQELGATVSAPAVDTPFGRLAVLVDPHGTVFSVMAPPPGAPTGQI